VFKRGKLKASISLKKAGGQTAPTAILGDSEL